MLMLGVLQLLRRIGVAHVTYVELAWRAVPSLERDVKIEKKDEARSRTVSVSSCLEPQKSQRHP